MSDTIKITTSQDMVELEASMQQIELQGVDLNSYVQQWVCQKAGFEPSPVCVLKPLASAMDFISHAFDTAFTTFDQKWYKVREAVAATTQDFERQEGHTVDRISVLLGETNQMERLPNGKVIPA